jgi:hypothetical protein
MDRSEEVYADRSGPGPDPRYRRFASLAPGEDVHLEPDGRIVASLGVATLLP